MDTNITTGNTQIKASIPPTTATEAYNAGGEMGRGEGDGMRADNNFSRFGETDYGRGPNGDYNTSMGYDNYSPIYAEDSMMDMMGGAFIGLVLLMYVIIFFLLPFYMIAVTDASVKRLYWWIFGMMIPGINLIIIPVYYFTKLDKLPAKQASMNHSSIHPTN